jgi:multiple sugar transport system permease protein
VGLKNFEVLFKDATVKDISLFTIMFVAVSTMLQLVFGMVIASLLNTRFVGRQAARTINLIPWAIPTIVAGLAFRWMLDDQYGLITDLISRFTGSRPAPLVFPTTAQISVILVNVWKNVPFMAVVLLAGLQNIPSELYEAAKIDGASTFQAFRKITIPLSIPIVITLGLFFVIWQLASFDLVYVMTGGGPGVATTVLAYRIFQKGMLWYDWGMASALSELLIFIVAVVGVVGLYLFKKYEVTL